MGLRGWGGQRTGAVPSGQHRTAWPLLLLPPPPRLPLYLQVLSLHLRRCMWIQTTMCGWRAGRLLL